MRKLAIAASAASIFLVNCTKSDLQTQTGVEETASSTAASGKMLAATKDYIVITKQASVPDALLAKIGAHGTVKKAMGELGLVMVSSSDLDFEAKVEKLPEVHNAVPDIRLNWLNSTVQMDKVIEMTEADAPTEALETSATLGLSGTNPFVPAQWSLLSVDAKGAFQAGYKGSGAVVAVLDGGFHLQHLDIKDNIIEAVSFVPGQAAQMANPNAFSHGTHVAGIIAASDNNIGTVGIAPSAKLHLVKVLGDNGSGAWSWIINGVYHAANKGVDIINMSLGGAVPRNGKFIDDGGTPNDPSDDVVINEAREVQDLIIAMNRSFQYARKKGALTIVAAGNDAMYVTGQGQGTFYPANCTDVVTISSNAPQDWVLNLNAPLTIPSSFTNFGASLIDLAGPGGDFDGSLTPVSFIGTRPSYVYDMVLSPAAGTTSYSWAAGTSMACPAASGVAALIVGKYGGNISPAELETKLKNAAATVSYPNANQYFGRGHVNAANAVKQ
ncbi:S8 family peptidase [Paracnuella aquatica]|uniref:S8 family peptidase n=1 Tax=Paracnuella aquatica TaxID=2268757 RepID=UPI000DEF3388|nr:S8 family serine peptidase [Paracnuella aquatica]RPD48777.1 peptidase S8 and S53 subtilisin kexin sedolisin [Paracnuella aquatica]